MKSQNIRIAPNALPKIFFDVLELVQNYFRVEVEGTENLPKRGRALLISNHSGCSGLDAAMLGYSAFQAVGRIPRILTLWPMFQLFPFLESTAIKLGLTPASANMGLSVLKNNNITVVFPEGVRGSFKPTSQRYHLQPFRTGFLRLSLLTDSPIVPAVVIGAEESTINLGSIQFGSALKGLALPIPLNFLPLPSKWKIRFLPPINLDGLSRRDISNRDKMHRYADKVRDKMQAAVDVELRKRKYVYFKRPQLLELKTGS